MTDKTHLLTACLILSGLFILPSCSNSYVDDIERGDNYNYRAGFPELRIASTAYIDQSSNSTIVSVTGEVVYGSLIYSKAEDQYEANFSVEINIIQDDTEKLVERYTFTDSIISNSESTANSQEVYRFEREFKIPPGSYDVRVVLIDNVSNKQTVLTTSTTVPVTDGSRSDITNVSLLTKDSSEQGATFNQATTYDIPSSEDSLKFRFQVANNMSDSALNIQMRLLKFRADSSIARPMNYNNYSNSNLSYIGIDYDEFEVVESSVRSLNQEGNVIIEYNFHELERGNYRLEVRSNTAGGEEIFKARDFSIKSPNYPSLKTPEELSKPLYYLMDEDEYEELMKIEDPVALKKAIDRFWLSNIKNSNMARNVIQLYYQRVEEANKQFSNFKEGWKTDPGMIYILFGPPLYVNSFSDEMVWSYSYNRQDPEKNFLFERTKLNTKFYPFNNYLLQRSPNYYGVQYRQIQRWLSGSILSRSF